MKRVTFACLVLQILLRWANTYSLCSQAYSYICILIGGFNIIVPVASCCTWLGNFRFQLNKLTKLHSSKYNTCLLLIIKEEKQA